jgi:ATP-dependent Clp protease ATP-binding subunit ClpA
MKPRHSESLILVWRVAEFEARQLKASTIEPIHLFLGLCKTVDLDLPAVVSKDAPERDEVLEELLREVRKLRTVFRTAQVNAKTLRRKLRLNSPEPRFALDARARLRRSDTAKQVFADAERFAQLAGGIVYPAHLLYAVLLVHDKDRDDTFKQLGIVKARLQQVAKREVVFNREGAAAATSKNKTHWN